MRGSAVRVLGGAATLGIFVTGCSPSAGGRLPAAASQAPLPAGVPSRAPGPAARPDLLASHDGLPPVISRIPVGRQKIVFLTIDDGWKHDSRFVAEVRRWRIPITVFLVRDAVRGDWAYFMRLRDAGAHLQDHTLTHPDLRKLSPAAQQAQICQMADIMNARFGRRPVLFRPPYGSYDDATRLAAARCGMKAVLLWREVVQFRGRITYQGPYRLMPGDIILQHFRPGLGRDFPRMLRQIKDQGFTLGDLADYLPAG